MTPKTIYKNLEKIFSATIESTGKRYPVQVVLKDKIAQELIDLGYIEEFVFDVAGVKCQSYALTDLGMLEYCSQCKDDDGVI